MLINIYVTCPCAGLLIVPCNQSNRFPLNYLRIFLPPNKSIGKHTTLIQYLWHIPRKHEYVTRFVLLRSHVIREPIHVCLGLINLHVAIYNREGLLCRFLRMNCMWYFVSRYRFGLHKHKSYSLWGLWCMSLLCPFNSDPRHRESAHVAYDIWFRGNLKHKISI